MRIAINARTLDYESGGPKEYLLGLVRGLLDCGGHELILYYPHKSHLGTFPEATEVVLPVRNRLAFDWLALPRALRRDTPDVAFFPSSNMPPGIPCPAVVAMLDLGYFHPTLRMYKRADTLYMRRAIRYSARRAEMLTAISEHTRADVLRLTNARPERVRVTPLACDPAFRAPAAPEKLTAFRREHDLTRGFILYAGNISPRKNLDTLLAAFAAAADRLPCDLAVTGGYAWSEDFAATVARLGLAGRVKRLGHIAPADMPLLYQSALALAFPSLFEGFGLPILEAQAGGTPVVCSRATSLPEVAGDGALLVDPKGVAAWAGALVKIVHDVTLREDLVAKGRANESRYSWERTAHLTLEVFQAAATRRRP